MRAAQIADLSGSYGSIDHGTIWEKVKHYELDRLYGTVMVPRMIDGHLQMVIDPLALSPDTLKSVHNRGIEYGIVRVPQWTNLSAPALAVQLSKDLTALGATAGVQCAAMANAEAHDFDIIGFLTAWRRPRPFREIGWGIEGMQGGRISVAQAIAISSKSCTVYGETYRGNMYPQAQDMARFDLEERASLPRSIVRLYYDGDKGAPDNMDGVVYTLERLP